MPVRQYSHIKQFVDFRDRQSSQAVTLGRLFCESLDIQLVVYTVFNLRHAITVILNNKYRMSTQFREVFQIMVSRLCSIPPERFSSIPNCIEIDVGLLTWTVVKIESLIIVHPDRRVTLNLLMKWLLGSTFYRPVQTSSVSGQTSTIFLCLMH